MSLKATHSIASGRRPTTTYHHGIPTLKGSHLLTATPAY
jgi:hypothetical protein